MYNAIFSKICLNQRTHRISRLYNDAVADLLEIPEVIKLDENMQHLNTSRLRHSINVSFYSFRVARFFGADARSAARAGLLHDMYYYDFKNENLSCLEHSSLHPQLALDNARKIAEINDVEEDIILSHMWPLTKKAPRHIEGYIVTFADKGCTVLEVCTRLMERVLFNKAC